MRFELGVVHLRGVHRGLEQHASVNRQPLLAAVVAAHAHLVRHRHVGVQVGVAGAGITVGEGGRHQPVDVHLGHAVVPGPGKQGVVLDEGQGVLHGLLVGTLDDRGGLLRGDGPQRRDGLHRGEGQVVAGHGRGLGPGVLGDGGEQFAFIHRCSAVVGQEELPCHLCPDR